MEYSANIIAPAIIPVADTDVPANLLKAATAPYTANITATIINTIHVNGHAYIAVLSPRCAVVAVPVAIANSPCPILYKAIAPFAARTATL